MGSLAGHIASFLLLFPIALRRLSSSFSLHLRSPPGCFRPRPWYFADNSNSSTPQSRLLRNADLHTLLLLLLLLPLAALSELLLSSSRHHSTALFLFWLLLLLPLLRHHVDPHAFFLPDDLVFLLAALAFLADRALSSPSSSIPATAAEARAYELAGWVTLGCSGACAAMAAGRASLAPDAALCMGLALKGTWALQAGLTLFVLPPKGCKRGSGRWALECELEEDRERAVALVDLLFVLHAVAIAAGCVAVYWVFARSAHRAAAAAELEAAMTRPMMDAEFELD